jgi:hypothetical protein
LTERNSRRLAIVFTLAALAGCTSPDAPKTVILENGVVLPILEGVRLLPGCEIDGFDGVLPEGTTCLEFPRALSEPPNEDMQNRYTRLLTERGFRFEGGASIQYWFSWPTRDGCSRRLNVATVPKTRPRDGGDWSTVDTFLLVMELKPESCETPKG